jgi:glycosyltransferase involved in cell wall biosynthesis
VARIAVVVSHPPFSRGGHLVHGQSLVEALRGHGHEAELVLTPQNRFGRQGAAYLATWLTDVGYSEGRPIDQVISIRFPSYAVRHPRHVHWMNHTMREYYDLWPQWHSQLPRKAQWKERVRRAFVHAADRALLSPRRIARLFAISETVKRRLSDQLGLASAVLYPPPPLREYRCEEYGDFFFTVSRLTPHKRLDLIVRAVAEQPAQHVRCVIAGEGPEETSLRALARTLGVDSRVEFVGRIDDRLMLDYYARCRAVCFPPLREDYGFVTAEAFASRKAVITTLDSGGPAELVTDGRDGLRCAPTPAALATALVRLSEDRSAAEAMGAAAGTRAAAMTWPSVVGQLVIV